ncbi:pseudouridine-5'-phosphate glycosidase [Veronia pacifica]|uniref:Pseudouridine-5'-phosphate glycosidase n=1 Tax=Veronia pacifica TaxID=1080227 RepID=A0A1C3ES22_9GAMM|nr:pseudouridine-5'-phosphate glycosidase [Veronia pacifica]ODA36052.1 pseudouridine-5-phosphate glycosidase [Veronia pacifica]
MNHSMLDISDDVQVALNQGQPVVALESTIISHGMPYPKNVETALEVEKAVRERGAIPATIAIIDGRLKVGLSKKSIEVLGKAGKEVVKVSRRDMPFVVTAGRHGSTTVAATMIIAQMAGIKVFATGGIGGVHRGAGETFDISADLQELAQTNVAVVCAGIKSILDLGLTLEYLETHGVPVIGYQCDTLPAFYARESDFGLEYRLDSPAEIANALKTKWALGLNGGAVIANPIPEAFAMDSKVIDEAIEKALRDAEKHKITGKASTPYLLAKVCELTGGESLDANIELVINNARLAADIAISM